MTGQLVPHATAMAARSAIARRRNRSEFHTSRTEECDLESVRPANRSSGDAKLAPRREYGRGGPDWPTTGS